MIQSDLESILVILDDPFHIFSYVLGSKSECIRIQSDLDPILVILDYAFLMVWVTKPECIMIQLDLDPILVILDDPFRMFWGLNLSVS